MARARGFTLVELMVVLVIVGLLGSMVALTLPDGSGALREDAETLAVRLQRAREEALLTNRAVEVRVTAQGYDFRVLRRGAWEPLEDGPFAAVTWRDGVAPLAESSAEPTIARFEPTGAAAPVAFRLGRESLQTTVSVDGAGEVRIDAPGV
ncbi:MAG: GspH/FimT family pseudopilin [Caulobacteraceae bacterium]|nr:GspH/FimT family pseudopilin [Caulobacteraceae bacterium]